MKKFNKYSMLVLISMVLILESVTSYKYFFNDIQPTSFDIYLLLGFIGLFIILKED